MLSGMSNKGEDASSNYSTIAQDCRTLITTIVELNKQQYEGDNARNPIWLLTDIVDALDRQLQTEKGSMPSGEQSPTDEVLTESTVALRYIRTILETMNSEPSQVSISHNKESNSYSIQLDYKIITFKLPEGRGLYLDDGYLLVKDLETGLDMRFILTKGEVGEVVAKYD